MVDIVAIAEFKSADEFLDALVPRASTFGESYFPDGIIYRGHSDSSWPLLPSAFRENAFGAFNMIGVASGSEHRNNLTQVRSEARALLDFFTVSDRSGLPLPEDSQTLRSTLREFSDNFHGQDADVGLWPPSSILALMAVAQHHGVPTRLLDWSWSAKTSAYFVASTAAGQLENSNCLRNSSESLCVWAMAKSVFDVAKLLPRNAEQTRSIELISTPASGNPNLHAQRGLFLHYRAASLDPRAIVDVRPWDHVLPEAFPYMKSAQFLYKMILPISQAPRLLRLLALEGVDGASIFPGFDGVVRSMKERRVWESGDAYHASKNRK